MSNSTAPSSPRPFNRDRLAADADRLRALHQSGNPLVLPNVWDASSARAVAETGFPAVATTSSGMSASLGWADGQQTPPDEMFAAIARVARVVSVPLSADVEGGYRLTPEELVARLLAAGAVGCNLEDTDHDAPGQLLEAHAHAAYLARVKEVARAVGVDIVLNARIDVFLRQVGLPEERLPHALERARLYRAAGADCLFPFGVADEATIQVLVAGITGPVNIAVRADGPSLVRLRELGVARISFAGGLARQALADHRQRVEAVYAEAAGAGD